RDRAGQAEISEGRAWRRGHRGDARGQAGARSQEHLQSGKNHSRLIQLRSIAVTTMRLCRNIAAVLILAFAPQMPAAAGDDRPPVPKMNLAQSQPAPAIGNDATGELNPQAPDTDLFALMTGTCS